MRINMTTFEIDTQDLLIEIGCEELPPKALKTLSEAFVASIVDDLKNAGLTFGTVHEYCTPRRLALHIEGLAAKQPDRNIEKKGPPVAAGMKDGIASPALTGFAKSCGVSVDALTINETDKGSWYVFQQHVLGEATTKIIPALVEKALNHLPIPKKMRWGNHDFSFVRPLRWLVMLFGDQIIPCEIFGVHSGNTTRGHRFHCPESFNLKSPQTYVEKLKEQGFVIVDFATRKQMILDSVALATKNATNGKGTAVIKPELLDEVTALVEWPVALIGTFETRFLDVPQEALISTMQDNQKYFPIVDQTGKLQPQFCFISNIESKVPQAVIDGNERVIRPRFSDAEFFWNTDKKGRLEDHLPKLEQVVFQTKLGSQADKTHRVTQLAEFIALQIGADVTKTKRAAQLAKCDLLTNMVQEFPELQGIMGRYYALQQGEDATVAHCLEQIYWPRFAGDALPQSLEAQALAIAERLDTIVGIFAIGQMPTGSKDPFSLRRNALGVLRILVECGHDLDLKALIEMSAKTLPESVQASAAITPVLNYILERMKAYAADFGTAADTFESVANLNLTRPVDITKRLSAVLEFRKMEQAPALANANKRISTILRKNLTGPVDNPVESLLVDDEEKNLYASVMAIHAEIGTLSQQQNYPQILKTLASLAAPLEAFFTEVMVMCPDENVRNNRLALLALIETLFKQVADISALQN